MLRAHRVRHLWYKSLARTLTPLHPHMGQDVKRLAVQAVNPKGKLYIPPSLGVDGFFRALQKAGARHVVLRWFENLPYIEPGHDLDILVADDAVETVRELLTEWPHGQQIDYYSETGDRNTGYQPNLLSDVPAFPQSIAKEMLENTVECPGGWSIPSPRTHFLGLAYHAVYLKGFKSGLPPDEKTPARQKGSRDYALVLTELAAKAGFNLQQPVTMSSIDAFLAAEGWRPSEAHLAALAPANSWIGATE